MYIFFKMKIIKIFYLVLYYHCANIKTIKHSGKSLFHSCCPLTYSQPFLIGNAVIGLLSIFPEFYIYMLINVHILLVWSEYLCPHQIHVLKS